jgi:spore coat protein CotH
MTAYEFIKNLNNNLRGEYKGLDENQIELMSDDLNKLNLIRDYQDIYLLCLKTFKKMPKISEIIEIAQTQGSNKFSRNKAYICNYDGTRNEYLTNVFLDKDYRPTTLEYWESFPEQKIIFTGEYLTKVKDYKKYDHIMTPDVVDEALEVLRKALVNVRNRNRQVGIYT